MNLTIAHGEYVVLLGPSGCGKTTTLRMIGGHETPTSGEIVLDGENLAGLPPDKRPTTTVFQHFALFPHRSVVENVEFGLKMHGSPKEERRRRAMETLEMVGPLGWPIASHGRSGTAAARRARSRARDEPEGAPARRAARRSRPPCQLRMRVELLRNLQRQLGLMFVHVTHNQEESLSMADRIVVMHDGRIQQVADPLTISTRPENELASFMGDNNIIRGTASREGDRLVVDDGHVKASVRAPGSELQVGSAASLAVRAAAVRVHDDGATEDGEVNSARPEIVFVEYLGDLVKLHHAGGERLLAKAGDRFPQLRGREGTPIGISWDESDVQLLGA